MRSPSAKRLLASFDLTAEQSRLIKRLCAAADDRDALAELLERQCPETHAYRRQCYHDPIHSHMWRVSLVLHAIDQLLGTHGVESLGETGPGYAPDYEYLNAGDTYATTLVYTRATDTLRIGCWGDLAERLDRRADV